MSYTALYRKFRPSNFEEVIGQDAICTTLKNQIKNDRLSHAYLFCGTRGTGKTSVAKILARAINCESLVDGNPCNTCQTCHSILRESSMNVIEIDAASNNSVDDIRNIKEQVQYPPTEGKYRVFIIDEVHMLSTSAFNALLKTLEEPPSYVVFILATTEVHKIPVTVLSRCQRYDFKRISTQTCVARLKELCQLEHILIEEQALTYIAKVSDGAMRDALSLLDECRAFFPSQEIHYDDVLDLLGVADNTIFSEMFGYLIEANTIGAIRILSDVSNMGRELSQFVTDFLWYLRNMLLMMSAEDASGMIDLSSEQLLKLEENAKLVTKETLIRYIRVLSEVSNRLKSTADKRVVIELALIKLTTPQMEERNDAILERISRLEKEMEDTLIAIKAGDIKVEERKAGPSLFAKEVEEVKELPRAEYDDFMLIKKDWNSIVEKLSSSTRSIYKESSVEPQGIGRLNVVFFKQTHYNMGSREESLSELVTFVKEKYKKEFVFQTVLRDKKTKKSMKYVPTKEELGQIIHMDITVERNN